MPTQKPDRNMRFHGLFLFVAVPHEPVCRRDPLDLDAAYAARRKILSGGAASVTIDSGQTKRTIVYTSLQQVDRSIRSLETDLENALDDANGGNGIGQVAFVRGAQ